MVNTAPQIDPSYGPQEERGTYLEGLPTLERANNRILENFEDLVQLVKKGTPQLDLPSDHPDEVAFFLELFLHTRNRVTILDETGERLVAALDMETIDPEYPDGESLKPYKKQSLTRTIVRLYPTGGNQFPQFSTNGVKGQGVRNLDSAKDAPRSGNIGHIWADEHDKRGADLTKGRIQPVQKPNTPGEKYGEVPPPNRSAFSHLGSTTPENAFRAEYSGK